MPNKSAKRKQEPLRIYLRLYPDHDLSTIAFLKRAAKEQDRSIVYVIRKALSEAAERNGTI